MVFYSFEKLFYSYVTLVPDYCSGVWEYKNQVQDRARRHFLGTQRLAPLLAIRGECTFTIHSLTRQQVILTCL